MVYHGRRSCITDLLQAKKDKAAVQAASTRIYFTVETEFRG
jgi:hypothetical protein